MSDAERNDEDRADADIIGDIARERGIEPNEELAERVSGVFKDTDGRTQKWE